MKHKNILPNNCWVKKVETTIKKDLLEKKDGYEQCREKFRDGGQNDNQR